VYYQENKVSIKLHNIFMLLLSFALRIHDADDTGTLSINSAENHLKMKKERRNLKTREQTIKGQDELENLAQGMNSHW
jgi:hypothetical protein